jgi:hypothetical protein
MYGGAPQDPKHVKVSEKFRNCVPELPGRWTNTKQANKQKRTCCLVVETASVRPQRLTPNPERLLPRLLSSSPIALHPHLLSPLFVVGARSNSDWYDVCRMPLISPLSLGFGFGSRRQTNHHQTNHQPDQPTRRPKAGLGEWGGVGERERPGTGTGTRCSWWRPAWP